MAKTKCYSGEGLYKKLSSNNPRKYFVDIEVFTEECCGWVEKAISEKKLDINGNSVILTREIIPEKSPIFVGEIFVKKTEDKLLCSYCRRPLGKSYSFNSIFVTPTVYKCKRWWCNLMKKMKFYKLNWD